MKYVIESLFDIFMGFFILSLNLWISQVALLSLFATTCLGIAGIALVAAGILSLVEHSHK